MTRPATSAQTFRKPTHQQAAGSDPGVSAWVTASAGTGKTQVLTDRVLRLLLTGSRPGGILCLTFTKAAAAEMKTRVTDSLSRWATAPREELAAELRLLQGRVAEPEELARARLLLVQVLDAPGGIPIQTIHAFCQSLLSRFPMESGVAAHFRVMDEATAAETLNKARDAVLQRAQAGGELETDVGAVTARTNQGGFQELMLLLNSNRDQMRPLLAENIVTAEKLLRCRLRLGEDESADSITAAACGDGAFDQVGLRRAAAAMQLGGAKDRTHGEVIVSWLFASADERTQMFPELLAQFFTKGGEGAALKRLIHGEALNLVPNGDAVLAVLAKEVVRLEAIRSKLRAAQTFERSKALLRFADALLTEYERTKERHAQLDYDDLILKAGDLLGCPGIGEWVQYKLDGGIDHILIDEAQDTSPPQWKVIDHLTAEFFAGDGTSDLTRTVFAVGDAKQSIYGFRRADPAAFAHWREVFESRVTGSDQLWRPIELVDSFRTVPVILNTVDKVFESEEAQHGLLFERDREVRHLSRRDGQAGFVELWPTELPEPGGESSAWQPERAYSHRRSPDARLAARIAGKIRAWVGHDTLPSRSRVVRAGDIMILVQRRTEFVEEMIRALKERDIPVAGIDRMVITKQLPVADLMALAEFVLLPEDELNLAVVLKGPFVGLSEDALFDLAHGRDRNLWTELGARAKDGAPFLDAHALLVEHLSRADTVPPHTFFAELLSNGGRRQLLARLGHEANDPVDEFLARALEYERSHAPSLQGFLRWIESGQTVVVRAQESGRDEVRVMTVHGTKGLQAPIVFLPDTVRVDNRREQLLWDGESEPPVPLWSRKMAEDDSLSHQLLEEARSRKDDEHRRLLYVAMTRAEDRLIVCGWETQREPSPKSWYARITEALESLDSEPVIWDGEIYRWSSPQTEPPPAKSSEEEIGLLKPLPGWAREAVPSEPEFSAPLSPSHLSGDDPPIFSPLGEGANTGLRRGVLIHRMLQLLPDVPQEKRGEAAARFLKANGVSVSALAEMASATLDVLAEPKFARLFGPGSWAEVPVAGRVGGVVLSGQIDRLLVTEHEVLIVDYKTHRTVPKDESEVSLAHFQQMAAYRAALREVYPDRPVRCALLWTDGPRWIDLSKSALDGAEP